RCLSDWSSDVCSSDLRRRSGRMTRYSYSRSRRTLRTTTLGVLPPIQELSREVQLASSSLFGRAVWRYEFVYLSSRLATIRFANRSEERRVGKECRSRG